MNELTTALYKLYQEHEETLTGMLKMRDDKIFHEMCVDNEEIKKWEKVFDLYDDYIKLDETNPKTAELLYVTCLWYIHLYIKLPEITVIRKSEDDKKEYIEYDELTEYSVKRWSIINVADTPYIFTKGQYMSDKGEIKATIARLLKKAEYGRHVKIESIVREVKFRTTTIDPIRNDPFDEFSKYFIPMKNGIYSRELKKLIPLSPVFGFVYCIPINYNPDANRDEVMSFLKSVVNPEDVDILVQMLAQSLMMSADYQKMYMLFGKGSNGKSLFSDLVIETLGIDNITALTIADLNDKFKISEIDGKLANISPDIPANNMNTHIESMVKMLASGDSFVSEKKYKDAKRTENHATMIFGCNKLPVLHESAGYAFFRRWIYVPFMNTFPVNTDFKKKLLREENKEAFLAMGIEMMNKIDVDGIKGDEPEKIEMLAEIWKRQSGPLYGFIQDYVEFTGDRNDFVDIGELYDLYSADYSEEYGIRPVSKTKFTRSIKTYGKSIGKQVEKTTRIIDRVQANVYCGITANT